MADYRVISTINQRLAQLLYDGFTASDAAQYFTSLDDILIASPKETAGDPKKKLSIFLYQITEDPYMKNRPAVRTDSRSRLKLPPLALRFHYLITPFIPDPDGNALVLGRVLETLYDNSSLAITDPVSAQTEDVRVIFETLSVGELAEVWDALKEPYRISLAYQLRVPRLESGRELVAAPVGESNRRYVDEEGDQ